MASIVSTSSADSFLEQGFLTFAVPWPLWQAGEACGPLLRIHNP